MVISEKIKIYISPSSQEANEINGYNEEFEMNRIADVLCPELVRHGFDVMRNNRLNSFREHIRESNEWGAKYHLAIHSNAAGSQPNTTVRGLTVFCNSPEDKTKLGTIFATHLYNILSLLTPVNDRGIKSGKSTLAEVYATTAIAAYLEIDFHDHVNGAKWIKEHTREIAHAILLGILETCGLEYIPEIDVIYRVQVGAFRNLAYAEKQVESLAAAGFQGYIVKGVL